MRQIKVSLAAGGVDGAIHRAAGAELLKECMGLHGCETGEAKITKGYKLPAKYVIHTVGPVYFGEGNEPALLSNCYKNSLELAKKYDIRSIAFPAISTGVYGYPVDQAAEIAYRTVTDWISKNRDYKIEIIFCCFDDENYEKYLSISE